MIPQVDDLQQDFSFSSQPSKTFKMNIDNLTLIGQTDGLEAMKQAVFLILNIERYEYIIYSWSFGIETYDLYGQPMTFVIPEIKRRIREALLHDERITDVLDFTFQRNKGKLGVSFTVKTIFGEIEAEKVVIV